MGADEKALAEALGSRKPKTRKGKRILEARQGQIIEDAKTALVMAGNSASRDVMDLLRDLTRLRGSLASLFSRKHPVHPFEDAGRLEKECSKHGHSLFAFGSSSKKRPFRLILGRLFDDHLLDMQEYSVSNFKSILKFGRCQSEVAMGNKPLVVFQGTAFESDERMKRTKSLLLDFFSGPRPEKVRLEGLNQVVICSTIDAGAAAGSAAAAAATAAAAGGVAAAAPSVLVRRYRVAFSKSGSQNPRVELEELGPSFELSLDRARAPDKERWKQAIKVPKAAKPKKTKNVSTHEGGKRHGRIHLGKQDYDQIHTVHHSKKKAKKLREELNARKESGQAPASAEGGEDRS